MPVLSLAFLIVWWFVLGPVGLGGPATFAIVEGRSMEPTYRDGDLVIARERTSYAVDDIIVFAAPDQRRYVIHRIVGGDALGGWVTRGDNNDRDDEWSLPDAAVLGREWLVIPRVGAALVWTQRHPLVFAAAVGALVFVSALLDRRRRAPHPTLAAAILSARRIPGRDGAPTGDVVLVAASSVAGLSGLASLVHLAWVGLLGTRATVVALSLVAVAAAVGVVPVRRLGDGVGLPEPAAARRVLAGLCWAVDELPAVDPCVDHPDARSLRIVADRGPGRVLRRTEQLGPDGRVRDTFLTVDEDGVGHRWVVEGIDPESVLRPAPVLTLTPVLTPALTPTPRLPAPRPAPVHPPAPVLVTPSFDVQQARLEDVLAGLEQQLALLRRGIATLPAARS